MNREETVDRVVEYIKDDNAKAAILINGIWGCGKTFLYKNYLIPAIKNIELGKTNRKDNIYISLYGISSINDLSRELLLRFVSVKTSKGTGKNEELVLVSAGIFELLSRSISFQVKNVSFGGLEKFYEKITKIIKKKNMVLCLDDLERCSIPINELFGWINNLTEHCNCKVIILADETNIGKMYANTNIEVKYQSILSGRRLIDEKLVQDGIIWKQDKKHDSTLQQANENAFSDISIEQLKKINENVYSENYIYKDIKEKVIGETITYRPSIKDTINDLIRTNNTQGNSADNYESYLNDTSDLIEYELGNWIGGVNYRTVIFWIKKFKRIYDECSKKYSRDDCFLDILEVFMKSSIACTYEYTLNYRLIHTSEGQSSYVQYTQYGSTILTFSFIDAWIQSSSWQNSYFIQSCKDVRKTIALEKHRNPGKGEISIGKSLAQLNEWKYKDDQEVERIILDMIQELKDGQYIFYDYPRILGDVVFFIRIGFCDESTASDVAHIMKKEIESSDKYCDFSPIPQQFDNDDDRELYKKYYQLLLECAEIHNKSYRQAEAREQRLFSNASDFAEYCKDYYDTFYENNSFLGFVGEKELLELISKSDLEEKYIIIGAIEQMYAPLNIRNFLGSDLKYVEELLSDIDNEEIFSQGKTEQYCRKRYIDVLKSIKEKLDYQFM